MTKGYEYALQVVQGKKETGKYVKLQCQQYLDMCDEKVTNAHFDEKRYNRLCALLRIINQAEGTAAGKSCYDTLVGFQWLILEAVFCLVDDNSIRFVQNLTLEISRKQGKSLLAGLILLIAMLTEPRFTKTYSISVNAQLAREAYEAIKQMLVCSPALYDEHVSKSGKGKNQKFYITQNNIKCNLTDNVYIPLANNPRSLDGKKIALGIVDEVGALQNNQPIEAMRASQITLEEKLTIVISTKYPGLDNPMEQEVAYSKKILNGVVEDPHYFSLLYEPDEDLLEDWATDDRVLMQANPLALEIPTIWEALLQQRQKAVEVPTSKGYFLTKNCNIMAGDSLEQFVDIAQLRKCAVEPGEISWEGRTVYVGVDLSYSLDNTSVVMVARDDEENIIVKPTCFIPGGLIEQKTRTERVDYRLYVNAGLATPCGDMSIDYSVVEDYVISLEETYGCTVAGVYMDPWGGQSSAQKWLTAGIPVVLVKQLSYVLHEPTSMLEKAVADGTFRYEKNQLLEVNFDNAKCLYDTNDHKYVNKKKSQGKIDMVAATINGVYGLHLNELVGDDAGVYVL